MPKRRRRTALQPSISADPTTPMTIAGSRRSSGSAMPVDPGRAGDVTDAPADDDVAEPDQRRHEDDHRDDARRRDREGHRERDRDDDGTVQEVVHRPPTAADEPRQVRGDPEGDQRQDPDAVRLAELVRRDGDGKPWDEPQVTAANPPARPLGGCRSGETFGGGRMVDGRRGHRTVPSVGSKTTTAVLPGRRAASPSRSAPQPG